MTASGSAAAPLRILLSTPAAIRLGQTAVIVVVEADVIAALRGGKLAGAYLDVFEQEPLPPDSALWSLDNVLLSPHSAGHSDGNAQRVDAIFLSNLARWCQGASPANLQGEPSMAGFAPVPVLAALK